MTLARLDRQLASCSAMACALLAGAPHATAAISFTLDTESIYTGEILSIDLGDGTTPITLTSSFALASGADIAFKFLAYSTYPGYAYGVTEVLSTYGAASGGGAYPYKLGAGVTIGPATPLLSGSFHDLWTSGGAGYWTPAVDSPYYLGFSVTKSGSTYHGWIALSVPWDYGDPPTTHKITVHGVGWETTPGVAIATGAVPEPTSGALALVALGAAGLSRWRREKSARLEGAPDAAGPSTSGCHDDPSPTP